MRLKTTPVNPESSTNPSSNPRTSPSNISDSSKTNVGAIAGGAVAGVVAVALCLLGATMLSRRRQRILRLFSRLISPSTSVRTPGEDGSPAELVGHNQANHPRARAPELPAERALELPAECTSELPAEEVAVEMDFQGLETDKE